MGRPDNYQDSLYDWVGRVIQRDIRDRFTPGKTILDVGAGWGKFAILLPEYKVDACEIWPEYEQDLRSSYNEVFIQDILDFDFDNHQYDVIIMSEVLEHIEREKAKELLERAIPRCFELYVSVPYLHRQGEVDGNPYEVHLQDDLTPIKMAEEYPLKPLLELNRRGLYVKK